MQAMPRARPSIPSPTPAPSVETLEQLDDAALRAEWEQAWGAPSPRRLRRDLLLLGLAWRLQAQAKGGLSAATRKRLERLAARLASQAPAQPQPIRLKPGTRLYREWRGEAHEVEILEQGVIWREQRYGSLSEVARAITGARRSGPLFFGLRQGDGDGDG